MEKKKFELSFEKSQKIKQNKLHSLVLQEEIDYLKDIEKDKIQIDTLYSCETGEDIECKLILRSTAKCDISLDDISLKLVDKNNKSLLYIKKNLSYIGIIKPYTATPFSMIIPKDKLKNKHIDYTKCKILFKDDLTIYESVKLPVSHVDKDIDILDVRSIERYVDSMRPMKKNTWEFKHFKTLKEKDEDAISTIFLVKNAKDKDLEMTDIVLRLKDRIGLVMGKLNRENINIKVPKESVAAFKVKFYRENINVYDVNNLLACTLEME